MASKPAAVVLNGPDVPLLANARTLRAADPNHSMSSEIDQLKPTCGRNASSASIVPFLTNVGEMAATVRAVFSARTERKPKVSRSACVTDHVSCRWNTYDSVSKSYSQSVWNELPCSSMKSRVGPALDGSP